MRILIAPDKFKGCLSAPEVARHIAVGLRAALPHAQIDLLPLADGGEGTAEVICNALNGSWVKCNAHDPLGRAVDCRCAFIKKRKLAIMEMSEAAGLRRLSPNERDVDRASTFGVGEMILDATRQGANEIIVGLGGSATNDGGFGLVRALGFRFFGRESEKEQEQELGSRVSELARLTRIKSPVQQSQPKIIAAADVRNPLLGNSGATRVFGPQKGATSEQVVMLERALTRLADVAKETFHLDYRYEPGAGAAGGLGFGLITFCGASIQPGFEVVAEAVQLEAKMKNVDVVITAEGSLDLQTLEGKAPAGVATMARKLGKPVYAIVGRASGAREVCDIFDGVYELAQPGLSEQESITQASELLREQARQLARHLRKTPNSESFREQAAQRPTPNE